jgi:uncharacterized protein YhaN
MHIEEIAIEGEAGCRDLRVGGLGRGLIVVQDADDGTVSTLSELIRWCLFGSRDDEPSRRDDGEVRGGRLVLRDASGRRYTVERYLGRPLRVVGPDGATDGVEVLRDLLAGVTRDEYTNIFAFHPRRKGGLTGEPEEFGHAMLNAAAGLGDLPVIVVRQRMESEARALFDPGAHQSVIDSLFREFDEAEDSLRELRSRSAEYDGLQTLLDDVCEERWRLETELIGFEGKLERLTTLSRVWPDWLEYRDAREELASLLPMPWFPDDGAGILERLLDERRGLQERRRVLDERCAQYLDEERAYAIDTSLLEHRDEIRMRVREVGRYRRDRTRLREMALRVAELSRRLEDRLAALGNGWDEERLRSWGTLSASIRLAADHYEGAIRSGAERRSRNETALAAERKEHVRLDLEIEAFRGEWTEHTVPLSDADVTNGLAAVARIEADLASVAQRQKEHDRLAEQAARCREEMSAPPARMPQWPPYVIAGTGFFVLLTAAASGTVIVGAVACVVMTAIAGLYWRTARHPLSMMGPGSAATVQQIRTFAELIAATENEISTLRDRIAACAGIAGVPSSPDTVDVTRAEQTLLRARVSLHEQSRVAQELDLREAALRSIVSRIEALTAALDALEDDERALALSWTAAIAPLRLGGSPSPGMVREVLAAIDRAREHLSELDGLREEMAPLTHSVDDFETGARLLIDECGQRAERDGAMTLDLLIEDCDTRVRSMELRAGELDDLVRMRSQDEGELVGIEGALVENDASIAALLAEGQSDCAGQFHERANAHERRRTVEETVRSSEHRIRLLLDSVETFEAFEDEIASYQPGELQSLIERLEAERAQVQSRRAECDEEIARIRAEICRLGSFEEEPRVVQHRAGIIEELRDRTRRWMRLKIALVLFDRTLTYYEQEREPAVFWRASEYLQAITGGHYQRILYPPGSSQPVIVDASERQKGLGQLDHLADQILLATRLGYIDEYSERAPSLPVLFDDLLEETDADGSRSTCRAIGILSRRHQVFYFTSRPKMTALLTLEVPGTVVIDLRNGNARSIRSTPPGTRPLGRQHHRLRMKR